MGQHRNDLEREILEQATPLFLEQGFDKVDMRTIASRVNIAVGTLYNYFPNKRMLFFEVFEAGWDQVLDHIDEVCSVDKPVKERILLFLEEFYEAMIERRGLGLELLKLTHDCPKEQERFRQVESGLQDKLVTIIKEIGIKESRGKFLARHLLVTTWSVAKNNNEDEEKQLHFEFVDWLLIKVLEVKGVEDHECTR